jgi:hypothetical protein
MGLPYITGGIHGQNKHERHTDSRLRLLEDNYNGKQVLCTYSMVHVTWVLDVRSECIHPSRLHIYSHTETLVMTEHNFFTVYLDNFTFPLTLWHYSFECHTGCLLFGLLLLFVSIINFLSYHEESGLLRTIVFRVLHVENHTHTYVYHYLLPERLCETGQ